MGKEFDYYGFKIYYRTENRKAGEMLILSFRPKANGMYWGKGPIAFESNPHVITGELKKGKNIEQIVAERIPQFLCQIFSDADKPLPPERQRENYDLPLAVLVELNFERLCKDNEEWGDGTRDDYRRQCNWIIEKWGERKLSEITRELCVPEMEKESKRKHEAIARTLRALFYVQAKLGLITSNPWEGYIPTVRREALKHDELCKKQISERALSSGQIQAVVQKCFKGIEAKSKYAGYFFAVLLLIFGAIPLEQSCALIFENAGYLEYYKKCLVVSISKTIVKKKKKQQVEPLKKTYLIRRLALAEIINEAYELLAAGKNKDEPIVRSPKNPARHASVREVKRWIGDEFGYICRELFDCKVEQMKPGKDLHELMLNTGRSLLLACGYDDEEFRYQIGLKPQETHARHYCDYGAESELNHMRNLQGKIFNKWNPNRRKGEYGTNVCFLTKKGASCEWSAPDDGRCEVDIEIDLAALDPSAAKTLVLMLKAPLGARFTVIYEGGAA